MGGETEEWVSGGGKEQKVSGPAEIVSFVCLVLFKDGRHRVSLRFHVSVSNVNLGNEEARLVENFLT